MKVEQLGNVKVNIVSSEQTLEFIQDRKKSVIFYLNAHCYNVAQEDPEYRSILNNADLVLNDGIGIDIGSRIFGFRFIENLNGTDHNPRIIKMAAEQGLRVFILGAEPGIAEKAAFYYKSIYPDLIISGYQNGYFNDSDKIIGMINDANTDVLFVAMGVPLQEKWIAKYKEKLNVKVIIAVGAFIDFAAGKFPRAPLIMRMLGMEWTYRLIQEPKRLWKRYLIGNFIFFYFLLKNRLTNSN